MISPPLRMAVVGLGDHAVTKLIPAANAAAGVSLAGVQTRNRERLRDVATAVGTRPFDTYAAVTSSAEVDVVYLATPTGVHYHQAMLAIEAGKHVWCEKPLTPSLRHSEQLLDAGASAGVSIREATMFLFHPQFSRIVDLVNSHELGALQSITARFGFPHLTPSNFRYDPVQGGGALLDAGFYPCAAAVALLGPSLEVTASAMKDEPDYRVDVGGAALVRSDASIGLLEWGFGRAYRNELELWFDEGSVRAPRAFSKPGDLTTEITIETAAGIRSVTIPPADHFKRMLSQFAADTAAADIVGARDIIDRALLMDSIATSAGARR